MLFAKNCSHRTKSNGYKLQEGKFRSGIRKKSFTVSVVRPWNGLPVDFPSLAVFRDTLDEP